jgi:hypothetical protein
MCTATQLFPYVPSRHVWGQIYLFLFFVTFYVVITQKWLVAFDKNIGIFFCQESVPFAGWPAPSTRSKPDHGRAKDRAAKGESYLPK